MPSASKVFGVALLAFAVAIAIVPMFTDCQSHGMFATLQNGNSIPMKCHWTGVAELGLAIPLGVVGGVMVASRRKETQTYMGITGIAIAAVMLAVPNGLIGVCAAPMHTCVTLMKPALTGLTSVALVMGVVGLVQARRSKDLT